MAFQDWHPLLDDLPDGAVAEVQRAFAQALIDAAEQAETTRALLDEARDNMASSDDTLHRAVFIASLLVNEIARADLFGRATLFASVLDEADGGLQTAEGAVIRAHLVIKATENLDEEEGHA